MKGILSIIISCSLFSGINCFCQDKEHAFTARYFSKIVINAGDSMFVETDTLLVDTLIMHDRARLNFLRKCVIGVSHAFIGDNCQFRATGEYGTHGDKLYRYGRPGGNGKDLRISIRFDKLVYLSIITNGGRGGDGMNGQSSLTASENGEDGARGGDGGKGGNVDLFYLSPNFIVVVDEQLSNGGFSQQHKMHTVLINSSGGEPGHGGRGGNVGVATAVSTPVGTVVSGNRDVTKGRDGESGRLGAKGEIRFLKTR